MADAYSRARWHFAIRGKLDAESGALISGVLEPLAAPAPATDGTSDPRDAGVRYADALVQICQVAASQLPDVRGERPTMLVTVGLETLENRIGCTPGYLDTGFPISAGAARKAACDANVIPILLGSAGQPLDVGRATRSVADPSAEQPLPGARPRSVTPS